MHQRCVALESNEAKLTWRGALDGVSSQVKNLQKKFQKNKVKKVVES